MKITSLSLVAALVLAFSPSFAQAGRGVDFMQTIRTCSPAIGQLVTQMHFHNPSEKPMSIKATLFLRYQTAANVYQTDTRTDTLTIAKTDPAVLDRAQVLRLTLNNTKASTLCWGDAVFWGRMEVVSGDGHLIGSGVFSAPGKTDDSFHQVPVIVNGGQPF